MTTIFQRFPSFEPLFRPGSGTTVPLYLELLNIAPGAREAIAAIREAGRRSGAGLDAELDALLTELNWRPQLVAGVALLVFGANDARTAALWAALDRPCWVSPQLAVVASRVDPDFDRRARERIEGGCPVDVRGLLPPSSPARHSALGPGSVVAHSAKLLSSLVRLVERRAPAEHPAYLATASIQKLIEGDVDGGGDIAVQWLEAIEQVLVRVRP